MSILRRIFSPEKSGGAEAFARAPPVQPVSADAESNPYTELQLLVGHSDIVRRMIPLDASCLRFATASDDGVAHIWEATSGRRLAILCGHTLPITCMALLDDDQQQLLVTGSSDRTMRVWDTYTGACKAVIRRHESSVKALCNLPDVNLWCCAGAHLVLFAAAGGGNFETPVARHIRSSSTAANDGDIHLLLALNDGRIVTVAQDAHEAVVYAITLGSRAAAVAGEDGTARDNNDDARGRNCEITMGTATTVVPAKTLSRHREVIRCLEACPGANAFATGSLDGEIAIWDADTFVQLRMLNFHELHQDPSTHRFVYSVQCLQACGSLLVAAIGAGFEVYDLETGQLLAAAPSAHHAPINHLLVLQGGLRVLTCSDDTLVRLWALDGLFETASQTSTAATNPTVLKSTMIGTRGSSFSPSSPSSAAGGAAAPSAGPSGIGPPAIPANRTISAPTTPVASPTATPDRPTRASHPSFSMPVNPSSSWGGGAGADGPNTFVFGHYLRHDLYSGATTSPRRRPARTRCLVPPCVGEMQAHTSGVNKLLACVDSTAFASCGSDALVALWKRGDFQCEIRNELAREYEAREAGRR